MSDLIGLANLVVSAITACAAMYLALLALRHSAKPRIKVIWQRSSVRSLRTQSGQDNVFIFDVFNVGHWYAKPVARDISIKFDCPWVFRTAKLSSGGVMGHVEAEAKSSGSNAQISLGARPFTLHAGEQAKFAIEVTWIENCVGTGNIVVKAQTLEGSTYHHDFRFEFVEN